MFWKMFRMDWKRCFNIPRMLIIMGSFAFLAIVFLWGAFLEYNLQYPNQRYDVLELLSSFCSGDGFKFVIFMIFAFLYTASFCSDDESHYLRMILTRTDLVTYTRSRFFANTLIITITCIGSLILFALAVLPISPFYDSSLIAMRHYYEDIVHFSPILYFLMVGLQLSLLAAACSSVGLLFSSYQCNRFVTIGVVGLSIFLGVAYMPHETIFSFMPLITMTPYQLFYGGPPIISYIWGILYMILIIVLCAYLFYRRMEWRVKNGDI